jgi:hypothetical protein
MNILVATPGRLLQHMDESPGFDASPLVALVLDEADRILDMVGTAGEGGTEGGGAAGGTGAGRGRPHPEHGGYCSDAW